jgi:hypothetical protein
VSAHLRNSNPFSTQLIPTKTLFWSSRKSSSTPTPHSNLTLAYLITVQYWSVANHHLWRKHYLTYETQLRCFVLKKVIMCHIFQPTTYRVNISYACMEGLTKVWRGLSGHQFNSRIAEEADRGSRVLASGEDENLFWPFFPLLIHSLYLIQKFNYTFIQITSSSSTTT